MEDDTVQYCTKLPFVIVITETAINNHFTTVTSSSRQHQIMSNSQLASPLVTAERGDQSQQQHTSTQQQ